MKKFFVACLLFVLLIVCTSQTAWAIDVGWMQTGVRAWYFGAVGAGGTSDAEEAYLFTSINGNTAQLTHHSGVNHWSTPAAVADTGSTVGEGPFWIHPQVLQTIAVGDTWRGIKIYTKNQDTYTYDTFKNTSELSSLPYLLLPIKTLFDIKPQRELIRLVYGNPNYPDFDPVCGTAYFDAETGLRLFVTQMAAYVTTFFILSEINYDFVTHQAFAEDNGPHTGFLSTTLKTTSMIHMLQILSSVESRYGGTVQMWTATQAGGAAGSYFGRNENYCFFGGVPVLKYKLKSATPQYPPENWDQYGEYLWWWVPTDALQKSTINVFGVPMARTSTAPYTFTATGVAAGLFFSKLIFDNDGYMTDFSAKDPSIGLDLDLGSIIDKDTTVADLAYYKNTMGIATPVASSVLFASFPGSGIWKWDGSAWSQTTPNTPEQMVTSGTTLYGSFTGGGIWKWDGTNWTQVTPNNPQAMVTLGTDLYGTFTGAGIWKWDGTTWTQVTPNNPQSMVMLGTDLYGAFTGQGIWKWNGSTWTQATPNTPDIMVATGTTLYGSFAGGGIWKWDGATWTQATPNNPQLLVAQGENLFGSFTGQGIWKWDGTTWTQATPNNPQQMVSSATELYGAFTGGGIWKWDGATWTQVTPNTPVSMVLEGGEIFLDHFDSYPLGTFPTSGGWILRYNGAGDAYQYIDNTHSLSGQQSMHMVGSSCWSSAMYHPLNLSSQVTYEAKVFVDAIVSCGCTPSLAVVRLINPSLGEWGTAFGSVSFNCDGNIYAMQATDPTSNVLLMPYNAQQWYKIKLKVNLVTRTFDVYVNDVLKGSDFQILDSGSPTGIEVLADHGNDPTVWFDDILVQQKQGG